MSLRLHVGEFALLYMCHLIFFKEGEVIFFIVLPMCVNIGSCTQLKGLSYSISNILSGNSELIKGDTFQEPTEQLLRSSYALDEPGCLCFTVHPLPIGFNGHV